MSPNLKLRNLAFGIAAAIPLSLAASQQAHALPYAFASNVDSGFSITAISGGTYAPNNGSFQTQNTIGGSLVNTSSSANGNGATVSDAPQVYFGPAAARPAENTFTQALTGVTSPALRADSLDSGFAGSGGNVAEANLQGGAPGSFGTGSGVLNSNNTSAITVTVAPGTVLQISFRDDVNMQTATRALGDETASAAISSSVSIQQSGATVFSFAPNGKNTGVTGGTSDSDPYSLNFNIASSGGGSLSSSYVHAGGIFTATTNPLAAGTYTILINQQSNIGVTVGTPVATPEPASLALLGAGLIGFGVFRRGRKAS